MEMNFNDKLSKAINMSDGKYYKEKFSLIYPFTTENISGYINSFDLSNKSLLTVGSSCDQVINASLNNCTDISVIDICPFTKYYFYLKKAAILSLNYNEFTNFFCYIDYPKTFGVNLKSFDKNSFLKLSNILKELDYESYSFWNQLFSVYKPLKVRKNLFNSDEDKIRVLKNLNLYLKNESLYNKSKLTLEKVNPNFIIGDIKEIKLSERYDNIWLSNIGQYLKLEELKQIVDNLFKNLNDDGKLLVCYLYQTVKNSRYDEEWAEIYNLEKVFDIFKGYNLDIESFIGQKGILHECNSMKDSILVYRKK